MSEAGLLFLLFALGTAALVSEVFIPSHGVLTLTGLGFLATAVYLTFEWIGREAGIVAIISCGIGVPTLACVAVKYWKKSWIGRQIAPPNPIVRPQDSSVPVDEINALIGKIGRTVSPLRPVGICDFDGKRISCVSKFGVIEADVAVKGTSLSEGTLAVIPHVQEKEINVS